ncbi:MAG: UDP-glucose/GDP-mannose dehydrogenase family protein [Rubrivivax sp.]|nr:UDP-glucose/GDP-mannose dehydrogenase family protein [Rubrivivax sp.]
MTRQAITVFGAGYVGLVTAAGLAELGHDVVCVDTDRARIAALRERAAPPFHEPELKAMIRRHAASGRLRFAEGDDAEAVAQARLFFIAVGTPSSADGAADVGQVLAVARGIGRRLEADALVVVKSTVPVGTGDAVRAAVLGELPGRGRGDLRVAVVSNPEFLREGCAVADWLAPDRIVVGSDDAQALATMRALYAPLVAHRRQWQPMRLRSAELTKYASNAMLAARVSVMNELALMAEPLGADIAEVKRGVAGDPRIGEAFLACGCGYGGSCLPKDLRALQSMAAAAGVPVPLLAAVERVNERQKTLLAERALAALAAAGAAGPPLHGCRVALWGLAFKPGTDDLREAPSEAVLHTLVEAGVQVVAHDPLAMPAARAQHERLAASFTTAPDALAAVDGADALLIVTEWPEYAAADWAAVRRRMRGRLVFDGRNVCDPARMVAQGFVYRGIGRLVPRAPVAAVGSMAALAPAARPVAAMVPSTPAAPATAAAPAATAAANAAATAAANAAATAAAAAAAAGD